MGATRVFLGVRKGGVLTCFDTWTRDYVCEDDPYIVLGRVLPPLARLGLDRVAGLLEQMKADETAGDLESAVEYWFDAVESGGGADDRAGVVVPDEDGFACGVVLDLDARAVDFVRAGDAEGSVDERGVDVGAFTAGLRVDEVNLGPAGELFEKIMEGRFGGILERPTVVGWEVKLLHHKDLSVLPAAAPREEGDDDDAEVELPPGFTRHAFYMMQMFIPTGPDAILVVTGSVVDGVWTPSWAAVAEPGALCPVLAPAGPYEVWHQSPAPFIDPMFTMTNDLDAMIREFDKSRAERVDAGVFEVEAGAVPDVSFIKGSFDVGDA